MRRTQETEITEISDKSKELENGDVAREYNRMWNYNDKRALVNITTSRDFNMLPRWLRWIEAKLWASILK